MHSDPVLIVLVSDPVGKLGAFSGLDVDAMIQKEMITLKVGEAVIMASNRLRNGGKLLVLGCPKQGQERRGVFGEGEYKVET